MRLPFIIFLAVFILELLVLFAVADLIGGLATVALILFGAVAGIATLRRQGWQTLARASDRLRVGQVPAMEMLEGICIAIGGALLILPGFISDFVGLLLLLPPTRRRLVGALLKSGRMTIYSGGPEAPPGFHPPPGGRDIYEGEFTREHPPGRRLGDHDRD